MRVAYRWLSELVEIPWDAAELANRLTLNGVGVETVEHPGAVPSGVVAARVIALERHPGLDRLWVARLSAGAKQYTVVTGWTGIAHGQMLAFAPPGSVLPKGWAIDRAVFGGVVSEGMLCAAREMLLGEPHLEDEDVLILDESVEEGTDLYEHVGVKDSVLELDLTPNYGHCLSMVGVATEVAAITGKEVRPVEVSVRESSIDIRQSLSIEILSPDLCPRYAARIVRDVTIGPSPLWLQARLIAAGMRPINNIVDITNYVMLTLGQPLHAFDYDMLRGKRIIVRRAGSPGVFKTLDGQERQISEDTLLIADAEGAVAVAGVMGGLDSEVTKNTRNILIESALFDPRSIRKTAARLGLRSEASTRFERGVDPAGQVHALDIAAALMCEIAGGIADRGVLDVDHSHYRRKVISLSPGRVRKVLGLDITEEDIASALRRLGFLVTGSELMSVTVPSKRVDIDGEIDLIEEVGRIHGYDKIKATLPRGTTLGLRTKAQIARQKVTETMVGLGLEQVINMTFASPRDFERCRMGTVEQAGALVISNPMTDEQSVMRQSLLPGLIQTLSYNLARKNKDLALFEIGTVFLPSGERLPDERTYLAIAASGVPEKRHFEGRRPEADFFYAKGVVEALVRSLAGEAISLRFVESSLPVLHPYRQARVEAVISGQDTVIGHVGEVHPEVSSAYGIEARLAAMEINLGPLLGGYPFPIQVKPIPRFPGVSRDIALVVPDDISSARVQQLLTSHAGDLLGAIELFDVYRGEGIPRGSRSLAYSMVYRSLERTLTDREVDDLHEKVRREVASCLGAVVR